MQFLHTSEKKREGELCGRCWWLREVPLGYCINHTQGLGSLSLLPQAGSHFLTHLLGIIVKCSQCRSQTGGSLHKSLHTPEHISCLHLPLWPTEQSSLWSPDLHMVIVKRTMYSQQPLHRGFVHFSSCVPTLALPYHVTVSPY